MPKTSYIDDILQQVTELRRANSTSDVVGTACSAALSVLHQARFGGISAPRVYRAIAVLNAAIKGYTAEGTPSAVIIKRRAPARAVSGDFYERAKV